MRQRISSTVSAPMRLEIEGVAEMMKRLAALGKPGAFRAAMKKVCKAGAKIILPAAKALAPRKTGKLRRGIQVWAPPTKGMSRRGRNRVRVVVRTRPREWFGIPAESKWYYPTIVEYGHPKPGREHAAPAHFMRQALAYRGAAAAAEMKRALQAAIDRAIAKARGGARDVSEGGGE